tara:strand:- start:583 stop:1236 length:654 start_codon:yes stop_codon:yes gene_type:complete
MSAGLYRENPFEYLNLPNVVMIGLAEKKAEKKFMGMATDQRRLFAVNKDTGDITYYKLEGKELPLEVTGECCNQDELKEKILSSRNENKITFKGFIPGTNIKKIEFDNSGTQANKGPEINIYTDLNNRIYTLYFRFGERWDHSAMQMRDNINAIEELKEKLKVVEQSGGAKRKTRRNRRKHKKQTHKKHSRKNRTRKHNGKRGKKLAKKSRKHRRRH